MIHLPPENDLSLPCDPSESLAPVKPGLLIDLSEILSAKALRTPSSVSTYDAASNKGEEELSRVISFDTLSLKYMESSSSLLESELLDQRATIKEIISKRTYSRRPREPKKTVVPVKNELNGKRRKNTPEIEREMDDVVRKKEKKEFDLPRGFPASLEEKPAVPEIVIKDGKVQMVPIEPRQEDIAIMQELQVFDAGKQKVTTSTSFKQMSHTEKWTPKETQKFYRALELFGTDFSMIARVFKKRNRNQIKNKFLREERSDPDKVNVSLKNTKSSSFQKLFVKYDKVKKAQNSVQQKSIEEHTSQNLMLQGHNTIAAPSLWQQSQNKKIEELENRIRERNERSGSFHSTTSIDSVDKSIMDDLAEIFLPQKSLLV